MFVRTPATILLLALGSVSVATNGCANVNAPEDDESVADIEAALELENGGLGADDEAPGFGDPAVDASADMDDSFADEAETSQLEAKKPGVNVYRIAMTWGHQPLPHDDAEEVPEPKPIDWTGSVSVDAGVIGVSRTLRFDEKDGVLPRKSKNSVEFASHTLPHVDGLLLMVVVPKGGSQVLHFDTDALATDIDLVQVAKKGFGGETLGDGRNGLAYVGFYDVPDCKQGFVFGRWGKIKPSLGKFRGHVVDASGDALGHVKGIWGHAPKKDKNVFFGKYIDLDGEFRGLLGGTYDKGAYAGQWKVDEPKNTGLVQGRYFDGYEKKDGKGFHVARWIEKCDKGAPGEPPAE